MLWSIATNIKYTLIYVVRNTLLNGREIVHIAMLRET